MALSATAKEFSCQISSGIKEYPSIKLTLNPECQAGGTSSSAQFGNPTVNCRNICFFLDQCDLLPKLKKVTDDLK